MKERGIHRFRSGDANFVAACMAIGVPPDQDKPCSVTQPEHGKPYASWNLGPSTIDGKEKTRDLSKWWSNPHSCACKPFSDLMAFIKSRPAGCVSFDEWLDHAHRWLAARRLRTLDAPRRVDDIPEFTKRRNDHPSAYIFAFVFNRRRAKELADKACPDLFMRRGRSWCKLSANLNKRQAGELLSRMKG